MGVALQGLWVGAFRVRGLSEFFHRVHGGDHQSRALLALLRGDELENDGLPAVRAITIAGHRGDIEFYLLFAMGTRDLAQGHKGKFWSNSSYRSGTRVQLVPPCGREKFGTFTFELRHVKPTVWVMPRRIALFGGSFNPPGLHHRRIAELLARHFDEVRVVPCGPRPDKPEVGDVPTVFRAALCDITFGGMEGVVVDLFDLEGETFTRNHALEERYAPEGEVWHVVGADWLTGGGEGRSAIHTGWEKGPELWERSHFAVLTRPGHELAERDRPPQHELLSLELDESSTEIRDLILHGKDASSMLLPRAQRYIERYGLYRGTNPATWSRGSLEGLGCLVKTDTWNPRAVELSAQFRGVRRRGGCGIHRGARWRWRHASQHPRPLAAAAAVLRRERGPRRLPDERS